MSLSKQIGFIGVSLAGGKTEKTACAYLEFFPDQKRLFLSELNSKILFDEGLGSDDKLLDWLATKTLATQVVFDVPLTLPSCLNCKCDNSLGPQFCKREDVQWMKNKLIEKRQRPFRPLTSYTQRPVDYYLSEFNGEKFEVGHALGSNLAPLTARAIYLKKRIQIKVQEMNPKVVCYALGKIWGVSNLYTPFLYTHGGEEARKNFLNSWIDKSHLFIYKQDYKLLIESVHAFNSLLGAYMGYYSVHFEMQLKPKYFLKDSAWSLLPKLHLNE